MTGDFDEKFYFHIESEKSRIRDRNLAALTSANSSGAVYGNTVVRSLIQVNLVGLIAIPAYILSISGSQGFDHFVTPAVLFSVGIFAGGLSGFLAYRNFYFNAEIFGANAVLESHFVDAEYARMVEEKFPDYHQFIVGQQERVEACAGKLKWLELASIGSGFMSAFLFLAGWAVTARLLLQ